MAFDNFICIVILSIFLKFYSIFFAYYIINAHTNYVIKNFWELFKTFVIFIPLFLLLSGIFYFMFSRRNFSFNTPKALNFLLDNMFYISPGDLIIICFFLIIFCSFILILLRIFYNHVKKCTVKLFLYYYQFEGFRDFCFKITCIVDFFRWFLLNRVKLVTKNSKILDFTIAIWPHSINFIEQRVFYFLLPYLIIFDLSVNAGIITKFFMVLPWFYLYTLIRTGFKVFVTLDNNTNNDLTYQIYGYNS